MTLCNYRTWQVEVKNTTLAPGLTCKACRNVETWTWLVSKPLLLCQEGKRGEQTPWGSAPCRDGCSPGRVLPGQELCPRPRALVGILPGGDVCCGTGLKVLLGCCSLPPSCQPSPQRGEVFHRGYLGKLPSRQPWGGADIYLSLKTCFRLLYSRR